MGLPFDAEVTLRPHHTSDQIDHTWASPINGTFETASGNINPIIASQ